MGIYLNPTAEKFEMSVHSEIYVDKSELMEYTNRVIGTEDRYMCISRPRRFGKSMAANMLVAYYSRGTDSRELFRGLKIEKSKSFDKHLNQYHVIFLNMVEFLGLCEDEHVFFNHLQTSLLDELSKEAVSDDNVLREEISFNSLKSELNRVYQATGVPFVFIIDEWDCIFRERKENENFQRAYLEFMRNVLKDQPYVALVYMTGILPIKKYGTHSALNMFEEFSMLSPGRLARFVGFTTNEVKELCDRYEMDFQELKNWYDGYQFEGEESVFSPKSVVSSLRRGKLENYWNQTETFEALKIYLDMNFDGLRDAVLGMLAGGTCRINPFHFSNDMLHFTSRDDVFTLLVHLGYLSYDGETRKVHIPNKEVATEFSTSIQSSNWEIVGDALRASEELLEALWQQDEAAVATGVERAHLETSHIQYNDENALSYTISLAFFSARNYYMMIRELPGGKGFADMAFIPRKKYAEKPAFLVELKWDESAEGAIHQIKEKKYAGALEEYDGNLLLVGINYDKKTRRHECVIEQYS